MRYRNVNSSRSIFSELTGPDGGTLVLDPGEEVELSADPNSVWLEPVGGGWQATPVVAEPVADTEEDTSSE